MNRWLFKLGSRPCHRSYLWVGILVLGGVQANVGEVRAADLTSPETLPGADLVVQTPATPAAVRRAYTLLNQGLVNDAIAAFRQALQRTPQSLDGKLGLAIAYQRAGRDPEAWTAYQQVLTQDPSNRAALKAVGLLGGYRPEWQTQGIEALNTLLDLTPDDTESRAQRALLLGYQGRFSESLADYERVLQRSPAPDVVLGAAQIYSYSGDYTRSLELFGRYQATGKSLPRDAVTAYTLALRETGNQAQAVQVLEQALVRSPQLDATTIQTRADLAQAYQANQQLTEALTVLEPLRGRADATLPLARALSTLGRREGRSDLYREAIPLYRQALANTPQPSFALTREVADVFSEVPSEREAALALYQQLVSLEPNDRSLLVKQLIVERQLGYLSQAELRQRLSSVLQPLPSESAVQRAIAQALLLLDPPDPELLNVYQDLLAAGVDVPFLNYRVAQIRLAQNDLAGARQALMAYSQTAVGTTDLASTLLLAEIEERSGDLEASAERYKVLLARNPAASLAYSALRGFAEIRLAQNRGAEAIALYDQWLAQNADDQVAQLGRARVAYQAERISQTEAEAVLAQWLQTQSASVTPVELFDLVGALPRPQHAPRCTTGYSLLLPTTFLSSSDGCKFWRSKVPTRLKLKLPSWSPKILITSVLTSSRVRLLKASGILP